LADTIGGAPQARERVFILAHRKGLHGPNHLKKITRIANEIGRSKPCTWSVSSILEKKPVDSKYVIKGEKRLLNFWDKFVAEFPKDNPLPGHPIWSSSFTETPPNTPRWKRLFVELNNRLYKANPSLFDKNWRKAVKSFTPSRRKFEWQASLAHPTGTERTIRDLVIQLRPSGVRVKPATYLPALVAINQTSIIGPDVDGNLNKEYRRITPKEAARLQGMDDIDFGDQPDALSYKQLGNAVNVGAVQLLAKMLTDEAVVEKLSLEYPVDVKPSGKKGKRDKRRGKKA
jgi:DNA (cytosine-5)-methyltransferase 1